MKKIEVFKNQILTNMTTQDQFESEEAMMNWLSGHIEKETFGKAEQVIIDGDVVEVIPAEYQIVISDFVDQDKINGEARQYLASTDYYIIRELDAGILCSNEIKELRRQARLRIK